jgi:hypothetical protein
MFLNLAAALKSLACECLEDELPPGEIETMGKGFYCGALACLVVQRNIISEHDGEACQVLLEALWKEAFGEVRKNGLAGEIGT